MQPAEEDVAGWPASIAARATTRCAVVGELAGTDELLEHRALGLLDLQEQRIVSRRGRPSARSTRGCRRCRRRPPCGPRRPARTARAGCAARESACAIAAHAAGAAPRTARRGSRSCQLGDRDDQRRIRDDPRLAVDLVRELGERRHAVAACGPWQAPSKFAGAPSRASAARRAVRSCRRRPVARTTRRGCSSPRSPRIALRYSRTRRQHRLLAVGGREAAVCRGDQHARGQPLDVPLPRPGRVSRRNR